MIIYKKDGVELSGNLVVGKYTTCSPSHDQLIEAGYEAVEVEDIVHEEVAVDGLV